MKKLILFALFSLLIIPSLVNAEVQEVCGIFKNCNIIEKVPGSFIAGKTYHFDASFYSPNILSVPLITKVNATPTSEEYEIWKGDFSFYSVLASESLIYPALSGEFYLKCVEPENFVIMDQVIQVPNGTFYCYNESLFIVQPRSENNLTIFVTPNLALEPSEFNFSLELLGLYGIPVIEPKAITDENGTAIIPDALLEIKMDKSNVEVRSTLYDIIFIEEFPSERPYGIRYVSIEANDTFDWALIKIKYSDTELKGLDESNLRIHRYDAANRNWITEGIIDSGVDTVNNYAWANVTHFSLFGVFTSTLEVRGPAGPAGSTGPSATYYYVSTTTENETCLYNWTCTEWSECSPENSQTRTCANAGTCPDDYFRPDEVQTCIYVPENVTQEATCSDGLQNQEETGIDCGGPCDPCPAPGEGITGFIVANPASVGLIIIILIIVIVVLVYLGFVRKRK